jgi:hypothetical protein
VPEMRLRGFSARRSGLLIVDEVPEIPRAKMGCRDVGVIGLPVALRCGRQGAALQLMGGHAYKFSASRSRSSPQRSREVCPKTFGLLCHLDPFD